MWKKIAKEALELKNNLPIKYTSREQRFVDYDLHGVMAKNWILGWTDDPGWLNFGLIYNRQPTPFAQEKCPQTMEYLLNIHGDIVVAGFSWLKPMCSIPPHVDQNPDQITRHLGLIVPEGCYIFCNGEALKEENGKMIKFDSNKLHSAINVSNEDRIILYILKEN